jgi:hypothetical protein
MQILGYHIGQNTIVDSTGEVCGKQSYLEFLLQPKPDTIRMMYDLDESVTNLARMLHMTEGELYLFSEKTKLSMPPYHLRYVPSKLFSVKRARAFAYYADASQYERTSGEDLAREPIVLANRAKGIGERVYQVLVELGISPTSLTSPARAYEKAQLKWLYSKRAEANGDPVKSGIIDGIGEGIYGESWKKYLETARV